jgi:uncharacterized protein (UPF0276 family)
MKTVQPELATQTQRDNEEFKFGVGLRRPHFDFIAENHEGVDFLEIITENFMNFGGRPRAVLDEMAERFPIIVHGVGLSIGSIDPLDDAYLSRLRGVIDHVRPPWFSDHLSYSSNRNVAYHDLIPLPFSEEAIAHLVPRIKKVQDRMGIPFLLENPSYYAEMPGKQMSEAEFVSEVLARSGAYLLLDVNNVFVNATNHGYDPYAFIDAMPVDRVLQIHIAGHDDSGSFLIDNHGSHIIPEVYDLYQYTLRRIGPVWTLLEWDHNIPTLDVLLAENRKVRNAASEVFSNIEKAKVR